MMVTIYLFGAPIAAMFLYCVTIDIIKEIHKNHDVENKKVTTGALLLGFIMFSIIRLCCS